MSASPTEAAGAVGIAARPKTPFFKAFFHWATRSKRSTVERSSVGNVTSDVRSAPPLPGAFAGDDSKPSAAPVESNSRPFLSAVTSEFEKARDAVAADLGALDIFVRPQSHFPLGSGATLEKLHDYIHDCPAVICIIGKRSGAFPPRAAQKPFLKKKMLPSDWENASYTQWEFFFAKHYKRRILIFIANDDYTPAPDLPTPADGDDPNLQRKFVEYITEELGHDRRYFSTEDRLRLEVLRQPWPTRSKALVSKFSKGLEVITDLKAHEEVRALVVRNRADLEATSEQIIILDKYKELHNCLHGLQMRLPAIQDVLAQWNLDPNDPKARSSAGVYSVDLRSIVNSARRAIPGLPTSAQEKEWVDEFDACAKGMEAIANGTSGATGQVSEQLMSLLNESVRINGQLAIRASLLPLGRLGSFIQTMDAIAGHMQSSASPGALAQLRTSSAAVGQLRVRIDELVSEHSLWQSLNTPLDLAAHSLKHRPQKIPKWSNFERKLTALCARHADEEWAREVQAGLKRWLDATSKGDIEIENSFAVFHRACLFRFFEVDKQLNKLCIEMTKVAAPLNTLISA